MATPEQIDKVREYCFDPSEELLPTKRINSIIDKWLGVYPNQTQEGIVLYNSTIDCLYYLIYTDPNAGTGSSGSKRTEKVGQVQVSVESSGEYISKWQRILDGYLNGDLIIQGKTNKVAKGIIIGGVTRSEIDRVNNNLESVTGLKGLGVDRNRYSKGRFDPFNPYRR